MKRIVTSALLRNGRGNFLLARRKSDDLYTTPGGKVEDGELIEVALVRELKEETGLVALGWDFIGFVDLSSRVVFFYYVHTWSGELGNPEPEKHHDWIWSRFLPMDDDLVEGLKSFKRDLIGVLETMVVARRTG